MSSARMLVGAGAMHLTYPTETPLTKPLLRHEKVHSFRREIIIIINACGRTGRL